jgi:hypothetical protein
MTMASLSLDRMMATAFHGCGAGNSGWRQGQTNPRKWKPDRWKWRNAPDDPRRFSSRPRSDTKQQDHHQLEHDRVNPL